MPNCAGVSVGEAISLPFVTRGFGKWLREDDILPHGLKYRIKPRATCGQSSELLTQFLPVPTEFHHILKIYIKLVGGDVLGAPRSYGIKYKINPRADLREDAILPYGVGMDIHSRRTVIIPI